MSQRETKAERDARERVAALESAVALRSGIEHPAPIPTPAPGQHAEGWAINPYSAARGEEYRAMEFCWSEGNVHGSGRYPRGEERWTRSASRGSVTLYASEADAWRAVRLAVEAQYAANLVRIDERLRDALAKANGKEST